jgi:phosphate transport system permease protein
VTFSLLDEPGPPTEPIPDLDLSDRPRRIDPGLTVSDHVFGGVARAIGLFVLVLTGSIGVFLGYQAIPTFSHYGLAFFTRAEWQPEHDVVGIAAVLVGTVEVALVALIVGFPLALLTAIYISEYAPQRIKSTLVALVDLMAAVPSIIYGLWGFFLLQPHAIYLSRWLSQNLGWLPVFRVNTDPNAAAWEQSQYTASAFIAGLCVAMMVIPLSCAIMRGVFALTPIGEREAAYALGATRWGMIRTVVLPFGRGGIIGGTMLGLGRALGETIAVLLIISPAYEIKIKILTVGTQTTSALIAGRFGEATSTQLAALLTAGFVLFVITLGVNTVAAIFVGRSRSGSATEI